MQQKLILVRGVPGSGKSTYAEQLPAILVEADQFFIDRWGNYQFDRRLLNDAHNWCQLEAKRLLLAGFDVVVANTFVKSWQMKFYIDLASDLNIELTVIEMTNYYQNQHNVPQLIIDKMASEFESYQGAVKVC